MLTSWPPALPAYGRASAQRARSGPKAGAQRAAEPGARPAERSAAGCLDEVEKPVTAGMARACATGRAMWVQTAPRSPRAFQTGRSA
ncbi:hypothetical protein DMT42_28115 [Streptomyces actuosus]|uniref:Uncharacterized protein n=1 Tax=Streptomyces actuosus TaxID=1885 RepID=A0A2U9P9B3_STRAS|nr:hypothetical protein DMT42_28115 [Streptomyces actuosus]